MKEKLERYLFRKEHFTYAVLDGASITDLPVKLYEMNATNICLYQGDIPADLVYVAPYLIQMPFGASVTEWILSECWGKHWGIFAQSKLSLTGVRKQFRSLLTVNDENGNPMLFRYYDPRVLGQFLKTCQTEELDVMFDKVGYYFVEVPEEIQLSRFSFINGKLKETKLRLDKD
ncbi:MAG: DUF4123 domain-containing protein [Pyrinomonadaceae bacterium]|nr:DUF4123 domain-containing protein [Pyrinomonadaceae bacterium]